MCCRCTITLHLVLSLHSFSSTSRHLSLPHSPYLSFTIEMHRCSLLCIALLVLQTTSESRKGEKRKEKRERGIFVCFARRTIFISNARFNETSIVRSTSATTEKERGVKQEKKRKENTFLVRLTSTYREAAFSALALTFPADATLEIFGVVRESARRARAPARLRDISRSARNTIGVKKFDPSLFLFLSLCLCACIRSVVHSLARAPYSSRFVALSRFVFNHRDMQFPARFRMREKREEQAHTAAQFLRLMRRARPSARAVWPCTRAMLL